MLKNQHLPLIALAATLTASAQVSHDTIFLQTLSFPARVANGWIEAHWMEDGNRFWYVEGTPGEWRFYEYDLAQKLRTPLLDNDRVRSAPAKIMGHELAGTRLPFNSVTLPPVEQVARFAFGSP